MANGVLKVFNLNMVIFYFYFDFYETLLSVNDEET